MPIPISNRSPLPISRNSDPNSTTRRSFSVNPSSKPPVLTNPRSFNSSTTPANSPSGFGRRLSAGNEGADEKENEQSTKPVKPRSSANGSKNFMAPTISAACKLSPSPRKKVLEERNEPVRSSVSLAEGIFSSTAEGVVAKSDQKSVEGQMESIASDSEQKKAILERPIGFKPVKRVTFADSTFDSGNSTEFEAESVVLQSDCVVTDLSAKNECSSDSVSRIIAPLDADPSFLPYDPKTNYLSPRPQFLYYKPNPRVSVLVDKENGMDDDGVRRLEDTFSSSDNTSDSMEEILDSDDSQRDSEDSSFVEIERPKVEEEKEEEQEEEEREEDIHGSESLIHERKNAYESSLKVEEGKEREKKVLPKRLILICSMLVVLLISCYSISVTYSPGNDSTILKALNISQLNQPAAVVDLAKANFNLFSQRFKKFSIESMSHLVNIGQGGGQLSPPLQFMNLTELQNDILVGEKSLEWDYSEGENSDWGDDDVVDKKTDDIVESFKEETFGEYDSDSSTEHEPEIENDLLLIETISNQEEAASNLDIGSHDYVNPEALEVHKQDRHECDVNLESDANGEPWQDHVQPEEYVAIAQVLEVGIEYNPKNLEDSNVNLESDANVEPLQDYAQPEEYAATIAPVFEVGSDMNPESLEGNVNLESNANVERLSEDINLDTSSDAIHPPNVVELPPNARTKTSRYRLMGTTAFVLAVLSISFAAFINRKRGNGSERKLGVDTNESLTKKTILTTSSAMKQLYQEKLSSHNWPTIDDVGESFSSAMSSYQSHNNKNRSRSGANDEAHSGETRPRKYSKRESFSSSDFSLGGGGSHSYGSFTTYERIPIKKATTGDDEVVTPVRRSSRLSRSHATS